MLNEFQNISADDLSPEFFRVFLWEQDMDLEFDAWCAA